MAEPLDDPPPSLETNAPGRTKQSLAPLSSLDSSSPTLPHSLPSTSTDRATLAFTEGPTSLSIKNAPSTSRARPPTALTDPVQFDRTAASDMNARERHNYRDMYTLPSMFSGFARSGQSPLALSQTIQFAPILPRSSLSLSNISDQSIPLDHFSTFHDHSLPSIPDARNQNMTDVPYRNPPSR